MRWTEAQLSEFNARRSRSSNDAGVTHARRSLRPTQPELPLGDKAKRKRDLGPKEHAIHVAVAQHLRQRAPGLVWWHTPSGELRDKRTAAKLKAMGTTPGIPDLCLIINGRLHLLELKRERGGSLSADQKVMHQRLRAAGAIVETARGLDAALAILSAWGAFGPVLSRTEDGDQNGR